MVHAINSSTLYDCNTQNFANGQLFLKISRKSKSNPVPAFVRKPDNGRPQWGYWAEAVPSSPHPWAVKVNSAAPYFTEQLNLSSNYFGDLIKKETGKTALEYVHLEIMGLAYGVVGVGSDRACS